MRRLIESMDSISKAAKKSTGPKFPGYWKGTDTAAKARDRMVGDESIIPGLAKQAKEKTLEWRLEEAYYQFKEEGEYTGIDPIVRQRMGMQAATQDEIRSYLDKNPPGLQTSTGQAVTTSSGAPVRSGGLVDVAKAADIASPDRPQSVARPPSKPLDIRNRSDGTLPPAPAAVATPVNPQAEYTALTIPAAATPAPAVPTPYKGSTGSQQIQKLNPTIKDVNKIRPGQTFKMPDGSNYTIKPGDTLDKIARGSSKPDQQVTAQPYKQLTTEPKAAPVKSVAPAANPTAGPTPAPAKPRGATTSIRPPEAQYTYTAPPGETLGTIPAGSALGVTPVKPGALKPSAAAPAPKNQPPTPAGWPPINRTPLTRQEFTNLNAGDREIERAAQRAIAQRPSGVQKNEAVNKLAEQFAAFMEEQDQYGAEYQSMVKRVGQRAKQGAMKTVWDPVKRVYKNVPVKQEKQVKEYENAQDQDSQVTSQASPAATASSQAFTADKELQNMNAQKTLEADAGNQDPNAQTTSPASPAAVAKTATAPAAPDVSVATAKTTMAGLKPALGPGVDTNAAATGVTKANLGQALNPAEQQAVSALTPLVMKAATIPSAAPQLRSALTNAGTMARATAAKQGKM